MCDMRGRIQYSFSYSLVGVTTFQDSKNKVSPTISSKVVQKKMQCRNLIDGGDEENYLLIEKIKEK